MPYPSPPEISTSYTAQEQALGDGTLPGQELDVDLASIRASVTAVIEFVKQITRSDGKLANGIVTQEALGAALIIGFESPRVWATGVAYTTRSIVFEGVKIYICLVAHTSSVFATDLASGRWSLLADLTPSGNLVASNNLSDVPDKSVARSNLQLGSMSTVNAGTGASDFRTNSQNDAVFQPLAAGLTSWAAIARAAGFDTFAATPSSANLRALLTDESGTGALLFAGGAMGTPSSLDLTNATGLPFGGLAAAAVTTAAETIAANNVDTQVPTSAAVKAYVDAAAGSGFVAPASVSSGTAVDFTVPSTANRIEILFMSVSLSGSDNVLVQLGDAGGVETTGYVATGNTTDSTSGFPIAVGLASRAVSGIMSLTRVGSTEEWVASHSVALIGERSSGGGYKTLSAAITTIRVTITGANTFDGSGRVAIRYWS